MAMSVWATEQLQAPDASTKHDVSSRNFSREENWPPLLPQHVETEGDDLILGMSREEDLDG